MNETTYLILTCLLVYFIVQNVRMSKQNKYRANYNRCASIILDDDPEMVEILRTHLEDLEDGEFVNKGRVLYIYALLHKGIGAIDEVAKLDLKPTILSKRGIFNAKKFKYNSDTFFWLIVTLIKAYSLGEMEVVEGLVSATNKCYDYISEDLVTKLFYTVHHCLAEDDEADATFLKDLWSGNYPAGCTYDRGLIGYYKYLAIATLAKLGEPFDEDMNYDARNFANMKIGRLTLRDYGILENFLDFLTEDDTEDTEE